jgi:hypothetical protein
MLRRESPAELLNGSRWIIVDNRLFKLNVVVVDVRVAFVWGRSRVCYRDDGGRELIDGDG